jgi:serine/threonine protein phosphatase 1
VIDRLIERSKANEVICLKGNHEAFMLEFLDHPAALDEWRQYGGLPTLMSYGLTPPSRLESDGYEELAVALRAKMPGSTAAS